MFSALQLKAHRLGRTDAGKSKFMVAFLQKCSMHFFLSMIRVYQLLISPLFPPTCRFTPTCSQYAIDAIKNHGVIRGFFMAFWRILRCHPFSDGGYDPVN